MSKETFTLQVEVTITDDDEIIVGNYPYGIFSQYRLFIEGDSGAYRISDEIGHISDWFDSREDCIRWIIDKLSKERKDDKIRG